MYYGLSIPNFGDYGDVRALAELAFDAERSGWDGFFVWDHLNLPEPQPMADPWVALTAIALRTNRIRLGPMVTPIPRRRPWKLARETLSIEQVSEGRLILGVGLGYFPQEEFAHFGDEADAKLRAAKLDEGLTMLAGLWSNQPFTFEGQYYRAQNVHMLPAPIQQPRIPVWVAGIWPNKAPFRRAARWDGVFPIGNSPKPLAPVQIEEIVAYVKAHRESAEPFDVVYGYKLTGADPKQDAAHVAPYATAGVTWWVESPEECSLAEMRERIRRGPPKIDK
ncbi:MAG: LLM class flavin-dependent oxidoreductase [Caldilineaceae bacterium]